MTKRVIVSVALTSSVLGVLGCSADVAPAIAEARRACGGFAGTPCPDGFSCVDDPRDDCDPARGGADCGGVCRRTRCRYDDRTKSYVSRSPSECASIRFVCAEGTEYFSDDCGCGCREAGSACAATAACAEGTVWDEASCSCVSGGQTCGRVVCPAGEVCCNASCGICTPPGWACTQQACL